MNVELTSGDIKLRTWRESDLESLVKYADNFNVWINLRDAFPHPYTMEDGRNWLRMAAAEDKHVLLAIEFRDELVGGTGYMPKEDVYRISAEMGYWLAEPFWGRGIMTRVVGLLTDHIFNTCEGISRIYADLFSSNQASAAVLKKNGFSLEAIHRKSVIKNGVILDEHRYVKFRS